VIGDVQAVVANPPGTTRGTYAILDDSGQVALVVQTKDLPAIGKTFEVTGVIIQDPNNATQPLMRELKRSSPGPSANMKLLLYGGGGLFLILLIVFIILLAKPKQAAAPQQTIRPAAPPRSSPPPPAPYVPVSPDKTTKIPTARSAAAAPPSPDKTQVFMSLGAEIVVDKGPDKDKEFTLHKQVSMIGRSGARQNEIQLSDDTVSKEQAALYYDSSSKNFTIKNESQTNVTQLNGKMLTEPVILNNGDLIEMGKTVLRFKKD
ncbi:MAG: FHA domain-containing protein, partial [Candidatus Aminicenantes bacterium]|nr:FHA domain-containing protein [Candidatus Aminicenantes bacterium]